MMTSKRVIEILKYAGLAEVVVDFIIVFLVVCKFSLLLFNNFSLIQRIEVIIEAHNKINSWFQV